MHMLQEQMHSDASQAHLERQNTIKAQEWQPVRPGVEASYVHVCCRIAIACFAEARLDDATRDGAEIV